MGIFYKRIVPSVLYNEGGRERGKRFNDEKKCLEALASGKWWKSWKGPDKVVEGWACDKLGWPTAEEPEKGLAPETPDKVERSEEKAKIIKPAPGRPKKDK